MSDEINREVEWVKGYVVGIGAAQAERIIAAFDALRTRVEALTGERDAATARAEMAVGALREMVGTHGEMCAVPAQCSALQIALLALKAGGGK